VVWHRHTAHRFDSKVAGVEGEARAAARSVEVGAFFHSDQLARIGEHPRPNPLVPVLSGATLHTYAASAAALLLIYDVNGWSQHTCVRIEKEGERWSVASGSCSLEAPG
jgi:hypothetical protein